MKKECLRTQDLSNSLYLSPSLSLFLSLVLSLSLSTSLSLFLSHSLCLFLSILLPHSLSLTHPTLLPDPFPSLSFPLSHFLSVNLTLSLSLFKGDHPLTAEAIARKIGLITTRTRKDVAAARGCTLNEVRVRSRDQRN